MGKKEIDIKPRQSIIWIVAGAVILVSGMVGAIFYGSILIEGMGKAATLVSGSVLSIQWLSIIGMYYAFLGLTVLGLAILGHGISIRH
jgi:hypothetical protein